jgi:hypothetical protein
MQPMHVMKGKIPPSLLLCWNQHKPTVSYQPITAIIAAIFFYFYLVLFSLCSTVCTIEACLWGESLMTRYGMR